MSADAYPDLDDLPGDLYPIRLQGPWQLAPGESTPLETLRLPLDAASLAALPDGPLQLRRRFQKPSNIDRDELVLLVLPPDCTPTLVELNGTALSDRRAIARRELWNLTPRLQASNELRLRFDGASRGHLPALREPVLLGIMPDAGAAWWRSLTVSPLQ